jgi:predicted DNA-binding protein
MSSPRFAPITAGLLARKGEAQPWNQVGKAESVASIPWRPYTPDVTDEPPPPPPPGKEKACSIRISAHDFERLGILAVKKNSTRQQLLKEALADFLAAKAQDYSCACLCSSQGACGNNCGSEA